MVVSAAPLAKLARSLVSALLPFALAACKEPKVPVVRAPVAEPIPDVPQASSVAEGASTNGELAWQKAQDVFAARCVVCHACYDAPCQLNLAAHEGVTRGASKALVYDAARLTESEPTRLFVDARSVDDWRKKGFFSVLPKEPDSARRSALLRMLELKREHPLPSERKLPADVPIGLDREQVCAEPDELDELAKEHPYWGMPYGLPALSDEEHAALVRWVEAGAPAPEARALAPRLSASVQRWEQFLNEPSLKGRLVARYIYEHLFLASLHFDADPEQTVFRLVRSRTPPGERVAELATRRPFDDPQGPVYYRLVPQHATLVNKTYMPYALGEARLARYRALFVEPDYEVKALPSYEPSVAANPFRAFEALPVRSRYRFMLEEAQFTLMGFIKGPVCRGQVALNVIEDRFWVAFVDPDLPLVGHQAGFLAHAAEHLALPAEQGSNAHLVRWLRYARKEKQYLREKSKFVAGELRTEGRLDLTGVWNGDGDNPNAALTVLRHFDSATVLQGFHGKPPKTTWVLSYPVLERIHYLLVAGFDVFGNVGHQLSTRMYMDFLRMEAEANFLALLPRARRPELVDAWYRGVGGRTKEQVQEQLAYIAADTSIRYRTQTPELELYALLSGHLAHVDRAARPRNEVLSRLLAELAPLEGPPRTGSSFMPELSFIEIVHERAAPSYVTLVRDSSHTNVAYLFGEDDRRRPSEDELTVLPGFVGSYPNALFRVQARELADFVAKVRALTSAEDYVELFARFGVRRTSAAFWPLSDRMREAFANSGSAERGLFDYNRLEDP